MVQATILTLDIILFMTDGFPELFNSKKQLLGIENIKKAFSEVIKETPKQVVYYLNEYIDHWRNNFPLQDDLTFIVFKVKAQ